jgi:hypothetical protein
VFYPYEDEWLRTCGARRAILALKVAKISGAGAKISIETAPGENGPWTTINDYTAAGAYTVYLDRDPTGTAAQHVAALVRWAVTEAGAATPWEACFEITAMLEK